MVEELGHDSFPNMKTVDDVIVGDAIEKKLEKQKETAFCSEKKKNLGKRLPSIYVNLQPETIRDLDILCDIYGLSRGALMEKLIQLNTRVYPDVFILLFRKLATLAQELKYARLNDKAASQQMVVEAMDLCYSYLKPDDAGKFELDKRILKEEFPEIK